MKRITILLILFILVAVGLTGYQIYLYQTGKKFSFFKSVSQHKSTDAFNDGKATESAFMPSCGDEEEELERVIQEAIDKSDISVCSQAATEYAKYFCISSYANAKADLSICDREYENDSDRDECYIHYAEFHQQPDICDQVYDSDMKEICYEDTAISILEAELNNAIQKAIDKNEISVCSQLSTEDAKYYCISSYANAKADLSICDREYENDSDRDECYTNYAEFHQQPDICEQVYDNNMKEMCYLTMANEMLDISLCEKIVHLDVLRDYCYFDLNMEEIDPAICRNIGLNSEKSKCYTIIVYEKGDSVWCHDIPLPSYKFICYEEASPENITEKLCEDIVDLEVNMGMEECRYICENLTIKTDRNITLEMCLDDCQKTKDYNMAILKNERDNCYSSLATYLLDYSLCEKITDAVSQSICKNLLELSL